MSAGRRRAESRGRGAERLAAVFLMAKGYSVLARRYRCGVGEVDLIARRGRSIAFVEVKARADVAAGLEAVTHAGRRRIRAAARHWLMRHPEAGRMDLRFDLMVLAPWTWPRHVVNAFDGGA
jgi:putative endonuclease